MKTTARILSFLLGVCLLFSLSACRTTPETPPEPEDIPFVPQTAEELWVKIDEVMAALASYKTATKMDSTYYMQGYEFQTSTQGSTLLVSEGDSAFAHSALTAKIECEAQAFSQTLESAHTFLNGNYYYSYSDGVNKQKFVSALSFDEFLETELDSFGEDVDLLDATNAVFEANDDGTWSLTAKGYTKKTVKKIAEQLNISAEMLGEDVLDLEVYVLADEAFRATEMKFTLVFDVSENTTTRPAFSMEMTFSDYNAVTADESVVVPEEYTEVSDVRLLTGLAEKLADFKDSTIGEFTISQEVKTTVFGQETTEKLGYSVSFGVENGAYYYEALSEVQGIKTEATYRGGVEVVTQDSETYSSAATDDSAKLTVDNLLDSSVQYVQTAVVGIEEQEAENTHLFTLAYPDVSAFQAAYEGSGIVLSSVTQTIRVTFEEDAVKQLVISQYYNASYGSEKVTIESQCTIDILEQEAETV